MNKLTLLVGLITISVSCGTNNVQSAEKDFEFLTIANEFANKYNINLDTISMQFVPKMQDRLIGVCHNGHITISRAYWAEASSPSRRNLLFHELGHCALARTHVVAEYPGDNCPRSIMFPDLIFDSCYEKHKDELDDEMWNNRYK